jgi:hypothetical protein
MTRIVKIQTSTLDIYLIITIRIMDRTAGKGNREQVEYYLKTYQNIKSNPFHCSFFPRGNNLLLLTSSWPQFREEKKLTALAVWFYYLYHLNSINGNQRYLTVWFIHYREKTCKCKWWLKNSTGLLWTHHGEDIRHANTHLAHSIANDMSCWWQEKLSHSDRHQFN